MKQRSRATKAIALVALLAGAAACTTDGDISDPLHRRTTWFSYLSADDIERSCQAGGGDRVRLVYWADRTYQVRTYDIAFRPDGTARMVTNVLSGRINDWFPWKPTEDPLGPATPERSEVTLSGEVAQDLKSNLVAADFLGPPPEDGRRLASHSFFWLAGGCADGQFHFQVWEHPDAAFRALEFPPLLFQADPSRIPVRYPPQDDKRRVNRLGGGDATDAPSGHHLRYDLIVHPDGVSQGRSYDDPKD